MSATTPDVDTVRRQPSAFAEHVLGVELFSYQREFVDTRASRKAAVCGRQVGKTEMAAMEALHVGLTTADTTVLIIAPTQRQSAELFRRVRGLLRGGRYPKPGIERETQTILELANGSRIISLPAGSDGANIRGYAASHIIVDEAAFVDDHVFRSVLLPMLATTNGTLTLLSTPFGKRGFLYEEAWMGEGWETFHVPTYDSPLVDEEWVDEQRATLSKTEYLQEIEGEFVEAADAYFDHDTVEAAFPDAHEFDTDAPVVLGGDIARHGADRTVIIAMTLDGVVSGEYLVSDADLDLSGAVGQVKRIARDLDVRAVCLDETGLGAGPVEMLQTDTSLPVRGVKFTIERKQSLYGTLRSALEERELELPPHRRLRQELLDLGYDMTRGGKVRIHAPDGGHDDHPDALALANWIRHRVVDPREQSDDGGSKSRYL